MGPAKGGGDETDRRRGILGEELAIPEFVEVICGEAELMKVIPGREAHGLGDAVAPRDHLGEQRIRYVRDIPVGVGFRGRDDGDGIKVQRRRFQI